jgi:uncharacterized repeat protein (TIGR02543 family)
MFNKNKKFLILGILIITIIAIAYGSLSSYARDVNTVITLNVIQPTYKVRFHNNIPDVDDAYYEQTFTYGTNLQFQELPNEESYIYTGHCILNWNTAPDGTGDSYAVDYDLSTITYNNDAVIDLYVQWQVNSEITYQVIHKKMNLDGSSYTTAEIEVINANEGDVVTPPTKNYEGFDAPSVETKTVLADSSTKFEYLYDRKSYYVSFIDEELLTISNDVTSGYYYYGQTFTVDWTPDVPGVSFTFLHYEISKIDDDNIRTYENSEEGVQLVSFTVEENLVIEPIFTSYPEGIVRPFNGTPWLNNQYAANHEIVYDNLNNSAMDEFMFGNMDNPTLIGDKVNPFSKKGITKFERNTTKTIQEVIQMEADGDAILISNTTDPDPELISKANVYAWIEGTTMYWYSEAYIVKLHPDTIAPFYNMSSATLIDLEHFDTSLVKNFSSFFNTCLNLKEIKGFINTKGIEDPGDADTFDYANDQEGFAYENSVSGYGMSYMFNDCKKLESLDVSKFNTSNVIDMKRMFAGCYKITHFDLYSFDTSKVKSFYWMFRFCYDLQEIDITSFDTRNAINMFGMFFNCNKLKTIRLGKNYKTPNLKRCQKMFTNCTALETIYAYNDFDTSGLLDNGTNMFGSCNKLVGARGTIHQTPYTGSITDRRYAKISSEGNPGYFTYTLAGTGYNITYDLDGGTSNNPTLYYNYSSTFNLSHPTKTGYKFIGWTGSNGETPELEVTIPEGSTGNKEYTAHYEPITYTIIFNANNGSGDTSSQDFVYDVPENLNANTYENGINSFKKWNTKADGTGVSYLDEEEILNITTTDLDVINLYAQWDKIINISFNFGDKSFGANKYINTNIKLFNADQKTLGRDFNISFNGQNIVYTANSDNKDAIISCQLEGSGANPYPGFSLNFLKNSYQVRLQANTTVKSQNGLLVTSGSSTVNLGDVSIQRINNKLYYNSTVVKDNNNKDINFLDVTKNMSNVNLVFGANMDGSNARRFTVGDFTNINVQISFLEGDLSSVVLPTPDYVDGSTTHTFNGWFTEPNGGGTQITSNTQFTGEDQVLYAYFDET